ncbi:MAG: hypothetical protein KFB93_03700 [Simkaniaceae bacterium]|nr:MAG: hypothetical protein KFB93_03700 [Simkaniaceae bacterium]
MAFVDCQLIAPQSPLSTLLVEPVQEGIYATHQGAQVVYEIFEKCLSNKSLPEPQRLAVGAAYLLTGVSMLIPLVNAVIFQIFVSVAGSYREALREAIDKGETETVKRYLNLGVSPNNIYDTKALLFRSTNSEIIEALIDAGADLTRTYQGMSSLEHMVVNGREDLAAKYFDRSCLDEAEYQAAIDNENWSFAAFLIRMGKGSLMSREKIAISLKSENLLELPLIQGNVRQLWQLNQDHGPHQIKAWVTDLQKRYPKMKVDWIWTALIKTYCEGQMEVEDRVLSEIFKQGALREGVDELNFHTRDFLYWAGIEGREGLVYRLIRERLLSVDSTAIEKLLEDPEDRRRLLDFALRLGYCGTYDDISQNVYRSVTENPLEGIVATQNAGRLRPFVESHTFEEFYQNYLNLKGAFPSMYTGWMWNVIYEIPSSHFEQYSPVQESEAITSAPPHCYSFSELLTIYDRINFEDPREAHYIDEKARLETLDTNRPVIRTPREIRKGLSNILKALETGYQVYQLEPKEVESYRIQIQWIIHYLKKDLKRGFLPRDKANVLIDMGKACLMCPGRYNDIFDCAIRRLKNEKVRVVSFEDQVQQYFADLRSKTLTRVAFKEAKGCVHAWENLVYHLHEERALKEPKPQRIFSSQMIDPSLPETYHFIFKSDAKEAFDAEYTPEEMMGVLVEFARVDRKRSQEENDFNELMMDAMVEAYSTRFPAIQALELRMKVRVVEKTHFEDQVLPLEQVEALFQSIDPFYKISRSDEETMTWTVSKHFADFKRAFLAYKIRPFTEDLMGYALPEVIHPLVMGTVLCKLRHLRPRITFAAGV